MIITEIVEMNPNKFILINVIKILSDSLAKYVKCSFKNYFKYIKILNFKVS